MPVGQHCSFPKQGDPNIDPKMFIILINCGGPQNGTPSFGKPPHVNRPASSVNALSPPANLNAAVLSLNLRARILWSKLLMGGHVGEMTSPFHS